MRPPRAGWLGAALAGALAAAGAAAAVPLTGAVPPPDDKATASATHSPSQNRTHHRGECEQLDAANIPACADHMPPRQTGAPKPAAPDRAPAAPSPPAPATMAPRQVAKPPPSAQPVAAARPARPRVAGHAARKVPEAKAGPWQAAIDAVHRQPILAGGASGALVLLLVGAVWGVAGGLRRRPRTPAVAPPRATPPTAFRRDVVLKDEAGRDWRAAGPALTPGVVAGSGAESQLRLTGDGVAPRHLMLWVCDGRLLARPLAEPVFLNDRLLKDATPEIVSTGDHLRLGRADFTIMID